MNLKKGNRKGTFSLSQVPLRRHLLRSPKQRADPLQRRTQWPEPGTLVLCPAKLPRAGLPRVHRAYRVRASRPGRAGKHSSANDPGVRKGPIQGLGQGVLRPGASVSSAPATPRSSWTMEHSSARPAPPSGTRSPGSKWERLRLPARGPPARGNTLTRVTEEARGWRQRQPHWAHGTTFPTRL